MADSLGVQLALDSSSSKYSTKLRTGTFRTDEAAFARGRRRVYHDVHVASRGSMFWCRRFLRKEQKKKTLIYISNRQRHIFFLFYLFVQHSRSKHAFQILPRVSPDSLKN